MQAAFREDPAIDDASHGSSDGDSRSGSGSNGHVPRVTLLSDAAERRYRHGRCHRWFSRCRWVVIVLPFTPPQGDWPEGRVWRSMDAAIAGTSPMKQRSTRKRSWSATVPIARLYQALHFARSLSPAKMPSGSVGRAEDLHQERRKRHQACAILLPWMRNTHLSIRLRLATRVAISRLERNRPTGGRRQRLGTGCGGDREREIKDLVETTSVQASLSQRCRNSFGVVLW